MEAAISSLHETFRVFCCFIFNSFRLINSNDKVLVKLFCGVRAPHISGSRAVCMESARPFQKLKLTMLSTFLLGFCSNSYNFSVSLLANTPFTQNFQLALVDQTRWARALETNATTANHQQWQQRMTNMRAHSD